MVSFPRTREKACKGTIFFLYMQAHARFSLIFVKKMLNNLIGGHNYDKEKIYSTFHTGIMHQQPKSGNTSGGSCNNAQKMHEKCTGI